MLSQSTCGINKKKCSVNFDLVKVTGEWSLSEPEIAKIHDSRLHMKKKQDSFKLSF